MTSIVKRKKGSVIIVGKKVKGNNSMFKVDGIVVYDSFCLAKNSSNIYLLQNKYKEKPLLSGKVYICGHGNKQKHTISGYSMKEIAEELYNNFILYPGVFIEIMSCYGKCEDINGRNMADLLALELNNLFSIHIKLSAFAYHTTLITEGVFNIGGIQIKYAKAVDKNFGIGEKLFYLRQIRLLES